MKSRCALPVVLRCKTQIIEYLLAFLVVNRYLYVKRESLVNFISPLDAIYKLGDMDF